MRLRYPGWKERTIHLCLSGVLIGGCDHLTSVEEPSAYDVYIVLLQEEVLAEGWGGSPRRYPEEARPIEHLVILDETDPEAPVTVPGGLEGLDPTTATDYEARAGGGHLESRFDGAGPHVLVSVQELRALFQKGNWTDFYERFPGAPGLVALSPVGFGRGGTQAVVYMQHLREGLWGHGTLYVLTMMGGEWRVTGRHTLWQA